MLRKKILFSLLSVLAMSVSAQNTFPANGNVGVGTTSPSEELEVMGDVKVDGLKYIPSNPSNGNSGAAIGLRYVMVDAAGKLIPGQSDIFTNQSGGTGNGGGAWFIPDPNPDPSCDQLYNVSGGPMWYEPQIAAGDIFFTCEQKIGINTSPGIFDFAVGGHSNLEGDVIVRGFSEFEKGSEF